MGGNSGTDQQAQRNLAQQQASIGQAEFQFSQDRTARGDALQSPLINYLQGLVSGDKNAQLSAAAPQIGQIAGGFQASKDQIYNQIPAGAGRDFALSQLDQNKNSAIASDLNAVTQNAYTNLGILGGQQGSQALQQLGASISSSGNASNTQNSLLQNDAANKAATMGFLGSLAGAGGTAYAGHK